MSPAPLRPPALALLVIAAAAAPAHGQYPVTIPRHPNPDGEMTSWMSYDPMDLPLAWTAEGELLVGHHERYSRGDMFTISCRGSGYYAVPAGGGAARALAGSHACGAVIKRVAISPDGAWVLEGMPPGDARLVRLHLATGRADTLPTGCAGHLDSPALSPGGGRIAGVGLCDRRQALYVVGSDGSGLRRVTNGLDPQVVSWSPDGERLAGVRGGRVFVVPAEGGRRRAVTRGGSPAWSPDGAWIAFMDGVTGGERHATGIFVVRPDGSGRREVFRNTERGTFWSGRAEAREGEPVPGLVWSPDGRWIAFSRPFAAGVSVWRVEVATGRVEQVTRAAS